MKVAYLQVGLQTATLLTAGLLISTLAGATLRPAQTSTTTAPVLASGSLSAQLGTGRNPLDQHAKFSPSRETVVALWRVDDRDQEDGNDDRYQGNIGDRGNFGNFGNRGNFGDRGNYGNFGDRGIRGDRGNYDDRRDDDGDRGP